MKVMGVKAYNMRDFPQTNKTFYFKDITVDVRGNVVEVQFCDGHKECFDEVQVVKSYDTLRLSVRGCIKTGVTKNTDTNTVYFVDSDGLPACGDSNVPIEENPRVLQL